MATFMDIRRIESPASGHPIGNAFATLIGGIGIVAGVSAISFMMTDRTTPERVAKSGATAVVGQRPNPEGGPAHEFERDMDAGLYVFDVKM